MSSDLNEEFAVAATKGNLNRATEAIESGDEVRAQNLLSAAIASSGTLTMKFIRRKYGGFITDPSGDHDRGKIHLDSRPWSLQG